MNHLIDSMLKSRFRFGGIRGDILPEFGELVPDNGNIPPPRPRIMPKTDSFFIRSTKDVGNTNTYHEKAIDLGAFVDALGKSVLRIHNIQVAYTDNTGRSNIVLGNEAGSAQFQLATQSQLDIVLPSDKSIIASGRCNVFNDQGLANLPSWTGHDLDVGPHDWTNGYLVGVEQIYLGGAASTAFEGDVYITVILECTVETLNEKAAMALALSQQ